MASARMREAVEKVIKALQALGDDDSIDLAIDLDAQVRENTDAEFAKWITANDHGFEVFLEAAVSVRVAAAQETRWTELGREVRFAVAAVEQIRVFADEELRRIERARRDAMVPPPCDRRDSVQPGALRQRTLVAVPMNGGAATVVRFPTMHPTQRTGTIPAPAPASSPQGAA